LNLYIVKIILYTHFIFNLFFIFFKLTEVDAFEGGMDMFGGGGGGDY